MIIEMVNDVMLGYWHRQRQDVLHKPFFEALPELKGQGFDTIMHTVYTTGEPFSSGEIPLTFLQGALAETVYIKLTCTPLRDSNGITTGVMSMAHNITDQVTARKKAEESERMLKESEARFRSLAENSPDIIIRHDREFRYLYVSAPIEKLTGIRAGDFIGKSYRELGFAEELCAFFDEHLSVTFKTRRLHIVEYKVPGTDVYIHSRLMPEFNEQGEVNSVLVLSTDISERKKAEDELLYRSALLEAQNETIPDALLIVDTKGKMLYRNLKFAEMWGIPKAILDENDDTAALEYAMQQLKEPQEFIDRVNSLYQHATGSSLEEIHFKNGKVIERYGNAVIDRDGKRYGWLWYFRDITEQKRLQQNLAENEERLRIALEAGELGTYDYSPQTGKLIWSAQTKKLFGLPPEAEVEYEIFLRGLHPEDKERTDSLIRKAMEVEQGGKFETEYRTIGITDERLRWVRSMGRIYFDQSGKPIRFVGVTQDITRQKQILESLQLQSLVIERMDEGVSVSDQNGYILLTNHSEDKMFGYEKGELIGMHVTTQNAYTPEENERIVSSVIEELKKKGYWNGEWHNRKKDGTSFYTYSYITSLELGGNTLFVCVQRDITEEKKLQEAVRASEQTFRNLADSVPQLVWMANAEGAVYYYNKRIHEYSIKVDAEQEVWEWGTLLHPEDEAKTVTTWQDAVLTGTQYEMEHRVQMKDRSFRWHLSRGYPEKNTLGNIVRWFGTATDVHEQKLFAQELEKRVYQRTVELEQKNEELEQFAYAASHDLQEPLRKIITYSGFLKDGSARLTEKDKDYLEKVVKASKRMSALIKDILNYSKIDTIYSDSEPTDLNSILQNVLEDFELEVMQKKAIIHSQPLPVLQVNGIQINQVFFNLIGNALKFSKENVPPVITIESELLSPPDILRYQVLNKDLQYYRLSFIDNGIGFEPKHAEQIFTVFQRLNSSSSYSGTGIGLALCRKIVNKHGGIIYAESLHGIGSKFHIILPVINESALNKTS